MKNNEAHINLLSDIRKSIQAFVDELDNKPYVLKPSRSEEWSDGVGLLRHVVIPKIEDMKESLREVVRINKRDGRPPNIWKSLFVGDLAGLWRIMTGDDASKDLASPFASFVAVSWASLGDDLPEISWASQIRRRKNVVSAAESVTWANRIREFALRALGADPSRTQPGIG
jgi:hypothetical protein